MSKDKYVAYVGTYTHGSSIGIHVYDLDVENGYMTEREVVPVNNASHVAKSNDGKYLYSIADEGVEVLKIKEDGGLEPINKVGIDDNYTEISVRHKGCSGIKTGIQLVFTGINFATLNAEKMLSHCILIICLMRNRRVEKRRNKSVVLYSVFKRVGIACGSVWKLLVEKRP